MPLAKRTLVQCTPPRNGCSPLRNGTGGREAAQAEALRAAGEVRASKIRALFIDTSPRPSVLAKDLAQTMDAQYFPLPLADARASSDIVKTTAAAVNLWAAAKE